MHTRLLAPLTMCVVLLAGCGLSTSDSSSSPTTTTPPPTFAASSTAGDQAIVDKLVLTKDNMSGEYDLRGDLGLGDALGSLDTNPTREPVACKSLILNQGDETFPTATKTGDVFYHDNGLHSSQVASAASMVGTTKVAKTDFTLFTDAANRLCLRRLLEPGWKNSLPPEVDREAAGIDLTMVDVNGTRGSNSAAIRFVGSTHFDRQTSIFYLDYLFVYLDRAEVIVAVASQGDAPSLNEEVSYISAVSRHLQEQMSAANKGKK